MRSDQAYPVPVPTQAGNGGEYRRRYKALSDKRRLCLCLYHHNHNTCTCKHITPYTPSAAYARPPCTTPHVQPLPPILPHACLCFCFSLSSCNRRRTTAASNHPENLVHHHRQSVPELLASQSFLYLQLHHSHVQLASSVGFDPVSTSSSCASLSFPITYCCRSLHASFSRLTMGRLGSMPSQTLYKTSLKTETCNQQEPWYTGPDCVFVAYALTPIQLDANPVSERLPHADVDGQATPESKYNHSQAAAS
jgi:hypothetical protein